LDIKEFYNCRPYSTGISCLGRKSRFFCQGEIPNGNHPFINMLTEEKEQEIWNLIKPELNKRKSEMNDKMIFGTEEIPIGSVYSIGFSIIKSFKIYNHQIDDKELIDITPEQILHLSNYDE
jgi:hypothetical protein